MQHYFGLTYYDELLSCMRKNDFIMYDKILKLNLY